MPLRGLSRINIFALCIAQVVVCNIVQVNYGYFKEPAGHLWTYGVDAHTWTDVDSGITFKYTYWPQTSGAKAIEKLQTGELDLAHLGNAPWGTGATRGTPGKMIYVIHSKDKSQSLIVRKGIQRPRDLIGKRVAYVQGSTTHYMIEGFLIETGLKKEDFKFLGPLGAKEQRRLWDRGELDAGFMWGGNMRYLKENPWCSSPDNSSAGHVPCDAEASGVSGHELFTAGMSKMWGKETWNNLVVSDAFAAAYPRTVFRSVKVVAMMDTQLLRDLGWFTLSRDRLCGLAIATQLKCDAPGLDYVTRALSFDVWLDYTTQQSGEYNGERVPGECALEFIGQYPDNSGPCNKKTMAGSAWSTWATAEFAYKLKTFAYLPSYRYYQSTMDPRYIDDVGKPSQLFPGITSDSLKSLSYYSVQADPSFNHCGDLPQPIALTVPGTVNDHEGGGFHQDGIRCEWQIDAAGSVLIFPSEILIEQDQDNFYIYEGLCSGSVECQAMTLLAKYTGGKGTGPLTLHNPNPRSPVRATSGKATIVFAPDGTSDRPLALVVDDGVTFSWTVDSQAGSCAGVDCLNGGTCSNGVCQCVGGWAGADCSSSTCLGTQLLSAATPGVILNGPTGTHTAHNADCRWILQAEPSKVVAIVVELLDLDWVYDPIVFYDGSGLEAPKLGSYSGYFTDKLNATVGERCPGSYCPGLILSSGPVMTVRWTSDAIDSGMGFKLKYKSIDPDTSKCGSGAWSDCSGHGTCSDSGCLCSMGWYGSFCQVPQCSGPSLLSEANTGTIRNMAASETNYEPTRDCSWVLRSPPNSSGVETGAIALYFKEFDVEANDLSGDQVIVQGLAQADVIFSGLAPPCLEGSLCSSSSDCNSAGGGEGTCVTGKCQCLPVVVPGKELNVFFKTDRNNYPPGSSNVGFVLQYEAIYECPRDSSQKCVSLDRCSELGMEAASLSCKPCPNSMYFDKQFKICRCKEGLYSPQDQSSGRCKECAAGFFADARGMMACNPCPAGTSAPNTGSEACARCAVGSFATDKNSTSCTPCGLGQVTPESGSVSSSSCQCPSSTFMKPGSGCTDCLEGLLCPGGNQPPLQKNGFWTEVQDSELRIYSVYRCRDGRECPEGALGTCASGRTNRACNNCLPGYYVSDNGECKQCEQGDEAPVVIVCICLILFVVGLIATVNADLSQQKLSLLTIITVGGQLIMTLQALGAIRQLTITWVEPVKTVIELTQLLSFNLDVIKVNCATPEDNPVVKFVFQLLLFPMCSCVILVASGVTMAVKRLQTLDMDKIINLNGLLLFMLFITLTLTSLLPFQCVDNPNGRMSMQTQPGILCYQDSAHGGLVALSVLGIIFYPLLITAWTAWATLVYPSRVASGQGLKQVHRYRFLFNRFTPECYFFGLLVLLRNLIVAVLPVALVAVPAMQVTFMGAVFVGFGAVQCRYWPWRTQLANVMDQVIVFFLVAVLLGAGPLLEFEAGANESVLGILLCLAVLGPVVAAVLALVYSAYRRFVPASVYGAFLCHHKGGAGALARLMKLQMAKHSSSEVFLDSDQLEDLDLIFDTVRTQTSNLVVLLTPELLKRMWCAGEIVTAHRNNISIVPVICDGFIPLSDDKLADIGSVWTEQQKHTLANFGISMDMVEDAYRHVQGLTGLKMPRLGTSEAQETAVISVIEQCNMPKKAFMRKSEEGGRARILVTGAMNDAEAVSTCGAFRVLVHQNMQIETKVVKTAEEMEECGPFSSYFVVILSRGMLRDPIFARILLAASQFSKEPAASPSIQSSPAKGHRRLEFVTASADSGFEFPSLEFYNELEREGLGVTGLGPERGVELAKAYRSLLSVLALPLSPHGSQGLMQMQVSEICRRFRRYQGQAREASIAEDLSFDNEQPRSLACDPLGVSKGSEQSEPEGLIRFSF